MRLELRELIREAGGLYSQAGLARRWSVTPSYVSEAVRKPHFPPPACLVDDDRALWFGSEADEWRATPRKPGPRPT